MPGINQAEDALGVSNSGCLGRFVPGTILHGWATDFDGTSNPGHPLPNPHNP